MLEIYFHKNELFFFLEEQFEFSKKKTVILIHNASEGNLFFKDVSKIINFVKSNDQFDYVILTTNFYDFNLRKVIP
jgi:hypothetical protein